MKSPTKDTAVAVGATIYFGSDESMRQLQETAEAFERAHQLGMFTVLWCYVRNSVFSKDGVNYEASADLTGQANHLAATIDADIVKQKQAETNGGYNAIKFGKTHPGVYEELTTDHPIDLVRYQVELEEKNSALEEAQQFIGSVLTAMTDVLFVCDTEGVIQQVNLALEALTIGLSAGWALMMESPQVAWTLGVIGTVATAALPPLPEL